MFATDYSGENTDLKLVIPYMKVIKKLFSKEEQKSAFCGLAEELFFRQ